MVEEKKARSAWKSEYRAAMPGLIALGVILILIWQTRLFVADLRAESRQVGAMGQQRGMPKHAFWYLGSPVEEVYRLDGTPRRTIQHGSLTTLIYYVWPTPENAKINGLKAHEYYIDQIIIQDDKVLEYDNAAGYSLHVRAPEAAK